MVATNKLKEYAFKIYKGDKDYSLHKVFRLFPKYFPKIAFYYTELLVQKQEELTRRTFQQLGYIKAVDMRNTAVELHKEVKKYKRKILRELEDTNIYEQSFKDEQDEQSYTQALGVRQAMIYRDLKNYIMLNREALISVEKTAQKYRYNDIFTEAATYVIKNQEIFLQICDALKEWQGITESYYQF